MQKNEIIAQNAELWGVFWGASPPNSLILGYWAGSLGFGARYSLGPASPVWPAATPSQRLRKPDFRFNHRSFVKFLLTE